MSSAGTVQLSLRKSNFCGEREPDYYGAPLDESRGPRRQWAGRRSRRDRNYSQPHENLGRAWAASLSGAAALGAASSRLESLISPGPVDTSELFPYRGARPGCISGTAVVPQSACENAPFRIQPSVVTLGGIAVA